MSFTRGGGVKTSHSKVFEHLKRIFNFKNLFTTHNSQFTKAIAFTLAETLIVMGIIGVVAALTLPNLNSSTGDREKVAKVKKIYQNLEDAYGRAEAVYGPIDEWFVNDTTDEQKTKRVGERFTEFMKISKTCGTSTGCFSSSKYLQPDGDIYEDNFESQHSQLYKVILSDGASMGLWVNYNQIQIRVDIDGPNKGKTQEGNDIFDFNIRLDNIDDTAKNDKLHLYPSLCPGYWTGDLNVSSYATAWVIKNGNLDYLKCNDLNWETKTSCK